MEGGQRSRLLRLKRLILYDLDGTLVDTRQDIVQSVNEMRRRMGKDPMPFERVVGFVGKGLDQMVADCLETEDPAQIQRGLAIYRPFYAEHLLDHSRLYPGAKELLDYFKGRKQAVLTNKPGSFSRQILEGLGMAAYFAEIAGGEDGYPRKPDPAVLVSLLDRHRTAPADALFIGDSEIDVETGRRAGVLTVAVRHGFGDPESLRACGPEICVKDFSELIDLARSRGW